MSPAELLVEAFGRIVESGVEVLDGLDTDQLAWQPQEAANPIGWLVWHLTRVQDDHVADVAGHDQVWTSQGFAERFDLPVEAADIGYGHTSEQVAAVAGAGLESGLLAEYLRAVHARTIDCVASLSHEDLDRIVDTRWDPPVTLGARLVSVLDDDAKHLGQAAYLRGLLDLDS